VDSAAAGSEEEDFTEVGLAVVDGVVVAAADGVVVEADGVTAEVLAVTASAAATSVTQTIFLRTIGSTPRMTHLTTVSRPTIPIIRIKWLNSRRSTTKRIPFRQTTKRLKIS